MLMISLCVNALAVFAAYKVNSLSLSGALAAFIVGASLMTLGGVSTWLLLIMLLVSSSLIEKLSILFRLKSPRRISSPSEEVNGRSAGQVLANSLLSLICLLAYHFSQNSLYYFLLVISIAGSTADTWASEIGILSTEAPRSLLTGKKMPPGKSGGVTRLGLLASFLGAAFISALAVILNTPVSTADFIKLTLLGVSCSIIDSLLGLSIQEVYVELATGKEFEELPKGVDPILYQRKQGWAGIDNSMVNVLSNLLTLILAWLLLSLF